MATYNLRKFEDLARYFDTHVVVPLAWPTWYFGPGDSKSSISKLKTDYFPYFYTPKLLRSCYAYFMYLSLRVRKRLILDHDPDAVLVSWAFPDAVAIDRFLRPRNIPFVIQVLGSDVYEHCRHALRRRQIVATMNRSGAVITVSQALKDALIGYGVRASKIHVSYNGVDKERFFPVDKNTTRKSLKIDADREVFLYIGNLKMAKGIIDLIDAFRLLLQSRPNDNLTLIYVGGGEDRPLLEERIHGLRGDFQHADIRVVGAKPHEELHQWISASDVLCLPSHSEGVPNVLIESMCCGVPVIATRVGGVAEVVNEDVGILVEARDIDGLASAMASIGTRKWQKERILSHVDQYNWDEHAQHVAGIISESCGLAPDDNLAT